MEVVFGDSQSVSAIVSGFMSVRMQRGDPSYEKIHLCMKVGRYGIFLIVVVWYTNTVCNNRVSGDLIMEL